MNSQWRMPPPRIVFFPRGGGAAIGSTSRSMAGSFAQSLALNSTMQYLPPPGSSRYGELETPSGGSGGIGDGGGWQPPVAAVEQPETQQQSGLGPVSSQLAPAPVLCRYSDGRVC